MYSISLQSYFLYGPWQSFLATLGAEIPWRERTLLGWFAPRGIVAASLAGIVGPKLSRFGYPDANYILPLIFLVIMITVVCHGFSLNFMARWLGLSGKKGKGLLIVGAYPWSIDLALVLHTLNIPVLLLDSAKNKLTPARHRGIPIHHGEIINDLEGGKLDLTDFDCLLAATDNDAYNSLICTTLANDLGHNRVFQIPFTEHDPQKLEALPPSLRGVLIRNKHAHFVQFMEKYHQGWRFKKTILAGNLNFPDQLENSSPKKNLPFLVLKSSGKLEFLSTDNLKESKVNDIVISFTKEKNGEKLKIVPLKN